MIKGYNIINDNLIFIPGKKNLNLILALKFQNVASLTPKIFVLVFGHELPKF